MSPTSLPSSQRSLLLCLMMAACVLGMVGGCAHGIAVPSVPLAEDVTAASLILEYRSDSLIRRIYNEGDVVEVVRSSGPRAPDRVRFGTYDVVTGALHLSGAEGQWLPPVPMSEVTSIARYSEPDLSVPAAVVIGAGSGALVGGWFWYNALEYERYEGEELTLYTAVLTAMTSAVGGLAIAYFFARAERDLASDLGPRSEWRVPGELSPVPEQSAPTPPIPAAAPGPGDAPVDGPPLGSEEATAPPLAVDPVERWRALKDRLVDVEIKGVWKRYRVGTAQPEGVQLKGLGALRGWVVPYGSITGVREFDAP